MFVSGIKKRLVAGLLGAILAVGFAVPQPSFATPPPIEVADVVSTTDGFTFQITNYDARFTYQAFVSDDPSASAQVSNTGLVLVTGMDAGSLRMVSLLANDSSDLSSRGFTLAAYSLRAPLIPQFGALTSTTDGFTVEIQNYDSSFTYNVTAVYGWATLNYDGNRALVTVFGLSDGLSDEVTVSTQQRGYATGSASIFGTVLHEGVVPTFGSPVVSSSGFTVPIDNFDSTFTYEVTTSPSSTATISSNGIVSVRGVSPNTQVSLSVITTRNGYGRAQGRTFITTSAAPATPPTPIVTTPVSTLDGFTATITNIQEQWDIFPGESVPGVDITFVGNVLRVTGLAPGQEFSFRFKFNNRGAQSLQWATVTGSALLPLTAPLYQSAFAQSATSAFVTWGSVDGATGYTVTASNGGGTCTNTINYCTVTGLTAGQTYTFSVVANRGNQSSQASVTTPVLMASALDVGGSLTSSTWKVGAVVVANPLIIGQYSILRHQWYRCAAAVAVQEAAPACEVIAGATGGTYTLTAADLGKYVTSHMTVTGGAGVVTATLANTRAVLAANAAGGALVDPDGKPLIAEIPTRQISVVGGTTITITGTGFTGVTSVLVNGTAATVLSATDTTLVISVPASTQVGLVDLAVTTPKGTVTEASALAYVAKQASISSKKKTLSGFTGSVTKLSTKQKAEIKAFVKANSTMPKLTCAATTVGVKKSTTEAKAALARAKAACSYATSVSKNVFTSSNGAQGKTTGKVSKLVTLTISN